LLKIKYFFNETGRRRRGEEKEGDLEFLDKSSLLSK
jgi:hypothetical protein